MSPTELNCRDCGEAYAAGTFYCKSCGHPVGRWAVGGWLLFFCIITTLLGPAINLAQVADVAKTGTTLAAWTACFVLGFSLQGVITGLKVWSVKPEAFKWLRAWFITLFVVGVLASAAEIIQGAMAAHAGAPEPPTSHPVAAIVYAAVWWSYFKRSKRVKATFGRNLGEKEAQHDGR